MVERKIVESVRDKTASGVRSPLLMPIMEGNTLESGDVAEFLKETCGFDMLVEVGAADYLHYPDAKDRFGVWYILLNTNDGARLIVKTFVNDPDPTLPSMFPLWKGADWMEREVYDMFGITFSGHPDLRRILMPEEFAAFPLRKDYPLRGRGERHNFPVITRAEG